VVGGGVFRLSSFSGAGTAREVGSESSVDTVLIITEEVNAEASFGAAIGSGFAASGGRSRVSELKIMRARFNLTGAN
jgi:hypothetical protein